MVFAGEVQKVGKVFWVCMVVLVATLLPSCAEDVPINPLHPDVGNSDVIIIRAEPNGISAQWSITGPSGYSSSGTGSSSLTNMTAGSYTLTWQELSDYTRPSPASNTQTLASGGSVIFTGTYVEIGFVYIAPGTFMMGSPDHEPGRRSSEIQHPVTLTRGFYMSKCEVTEQWWHQVMGGTPANPQLPKDYVSWDMAVQFCNALSIREGLAPAYAIHGPNGDVTWNQDANGYRLPTEAEWEYACRATTTMAYNNNTNCLSSSIEANFGGSLSQLPGCPLGICRGTRTEVGSFPANQWGLYDMHGNVWEWVWCGWRTYSSSAQEDPVTSPGPSWMRMIRGGSWNEFAPDCRSASGYPRGPWEGVYFNVGFRPVRSAL